MTNQIVYLVDQSLAPVAALRVDRENDSYHGTICLDMTPPELRRLFETFEEYVEGQVFTLADEVERKINACRLRIHFPDGTGMLVADLQVYPSTGLVSFKVSEPLPPRTMASPGELAGKVLH
jgi:hypothetical protein